MKKINTICCWSGGKDSSMALHQILQDDRYDVKYLLSTFNANHRRLSMHGIRETLIAKQADAIGLPLVKVYVDDNTNTTYEQKMLDAFCEAKSQGVEAVIFGDIFLEDLKLYRDKMLQQAGLKGIYPLWRQDTNTLLKRFIALRFRSKICCINTQHMPEAFAGADIDKSFADNLPADVDACGENGEYHSYCYAGPIFQEPISIETGEEHRVEIPIQHLQKEKSTIHQFIYTDILPTP